MRQLEGFIDLKHPNHICKLSKAIYELKQAPRVWFDHLKTTLIHWAFKNTKSDSSLFIYKTQAYVLLILIYVDDILVTGNNEQRMQQFVTRLNLVFSLKDLRKIHYFLRIEVDRDERGIFFTQRKYISDVFEIV